MITRPRTSRRTRTRRPRFLSLGRQLAPPPTSPESTVQTAFGGGVDCRKQEQKREQQLDLFPLHREFEVRAEEEEEEEQEEEEEDDDSPSSRFFVDPEFGANATLASLLGATTTTSPSVAVEERESLSASPSPSPSVNYGLARAALRGRERWVFCHEEDEEEGEASSGKGGGGGMAGIWRSGEPPRGMLCLKLDYEEVLTAWSDKGSLYIEGEGPQIVHHHHQTLYVDVGGGANTTTTTSSSSSSSMGLWTVPENTNGKCSLETSKTNGSREERVMRYREKRQTRLFSKKIRYEVRKLNAEKRPRIKGRFVKRRMEEVA